MESAIVAEAVEGAIKSIVEKIQSKEFTAVDLAALLKLIQIEKDIREDTPKQVNVRWVESWESSYLNDE